MMRRMALAAVLTGAALAWSGPGTTALADSPVSPFLNLQTNGVVHADLTVIDLDAVLAWETKLIANSSKKDPNDAQQQAQFGQQIDHAKQWVSDFKAAGGKDAYAVIQLSALMTGAPGEVVVPLDATANPDALGKVFVPEETAPPGGDPNNPPPPSGPFGRPTPATAVIGQSLVFSTTTMVNELKTSKPDARADLTDALSSPGDAPVRLVFSPSSIKNLPFLRMLAMRMGPSTQPGAPKMPLSDPAWDGVTWGCVTIHPPPTESGSVIYQCKDGAAAQALADLLNTDIDQMRTDKQFGDQTDKVADALKPVVSGSQVVTTLDQPTFDAVAQIMVDHRGMGRMGRRPRPPMPPPQQ